MDVEFCSSKYKNISLWNPKKKERHAFDFVVVFWLHVCIHANANASANAKLGFLCLGIVTSSSEFKTSWFLRFILPINKDCRKIRRSLLVSLIMR